MHAHITNSDAQNIDFKFITGTFLNIFFTDSRTALYCHANQQFTYFVKFNSKLVKLQHQSTRLTFYMAQ